MSSTWILAALRSPSLMQQLLARESARILHGLISSTISHSDSASRVRPSAMSAAARLVRSVRWLGSSRTISHISSSSIASLYSASDSPLLPFLYASLPLCRRSSASMMACACRSARYLAASSSSRLTRSSPMSVSASPTSSHAMCACFWYTSRIPSDRVNTSFAMRTSSSAATSLSSISTWRNSARRRFISSSLSTCVRTSASSSSSSSPSCDSSSSSCSTLRSSSSSRKLRSSPPDPPLSPPPPLSSSLSKSSTLRRPKLAICIFTVAVKLVSWSRANTRSWS
mmetsp:Transcript_33118/g.83500  ORF Transcript_33118/g.83500 Transcript_33118/m.83500 type:complete len:284 (+) Transcript_33118:5661-6512(+)